MIRAVYEGIAFAHKYHIEALQKVSHKPEVIRMSGGACNSSSWVQMFANVLNVPVELVNATELGGLGEQLLLPWELGYIAHWKRHLDRCPALSAIMIHNLTR